MFEKLINDLKAALADVPGEHADDIEAVAISANRLAEDVSNPKPNKKAIQISADGLKRAAENIAAIASPVLVTVQAILAFVSKLHQ